jgi:hypothetical protein
VPAKAYVNALGCDGLAVFDISPQRDEIQEIGGNMSGKKTANLRSPIGLSPKRRTNRVKSGFGGASVAQSQPESTLLQAEGPRRCWPREVS